MRTQVRSTRSDKFQKSWIVGGTLVCVEIPAKTGIQKFRQLLDLARCAPPARPDALRIMLLGMHQDARKRRRDTGGSAHVVPRAASSHHVLHVQDRSRTLRGRADQPLSLADQFPG